MRVCREREGESEAERDEGAKVKEEKAKGGAEV